MYVGNGSKCNEQESKMAGIYIHIPFCEQVCYYCDFHFTVSLKQKFSLIKALLREIELQRDYLNGATVETVYFGGGTPSILTAGEIAGLLEQIYLYHTVTAYPEITLEVNPEHVTPTYIQNLKNLGINRISIGIQSLRNQTLQFLNRSHSAQQAYQALEDIQSTGITNINADLIYGIPGIPPSDWEKELEEMTQTGITHLSCYLLTIEPRTVFGRYNTSPANEEKAWKDFQVLLRKCREHGFVPYEISNYSIPGWESRHNSSYWTGKKYLGIGPAAHSFNKTSRQWNISFNQKYIEDLNQDRIPCSVEQLDRQTAYNDYVLTALRTKWGVNPEYVHKQFGAPYIKHLWNQITKYTQHQLMYFHQGGYILTDQGWFIADRITEDFILI